MHILLAIPAYNEEAAIGPNLRVLAKKLRELPEHSFDVVIAENGSTDATEAVVRSFLPGHPAFRLLRVPVRGKGAAIRAAWTSAAADVYVFMDADLATDLSALPMLIADMNASDLVIGSRALSDSSVRRSWLRRAISRGYRLYGRALLGTAIRDLACGFKAASNRTLREILPQVKDDAWFFDTELVIRAERAGSRIKEIPVRWREDAPGGRRSKVDLVRVARQYISACWRLRQALIREGLMEPWRRTEAAAVLGLGAGLASVSSAPFIYGLFEAGKRGLTVSGISLFAPGDMAVYLSQISQAMAGHHFWSNPFTLENAMPVPFVFWSVVGFLGRWLHLNPVGAFQAARAAGAFAMAAGIWFFCREVFPESRGRRLWAAVLALGGSGLGMFLLRAGSPPGSEQFPTDLWVSESLPFSSALHSGHFGFSWALLVFALAMLLRFFKHGRGRDAILGGAAGAVLVSFHPFYAVTLAALALVWSVASVVLRGADGKIFRGVAVFVGLLVPSALFQLAIPLSDAGWAAVNAANITRTPDIWWVAVGFGVWLPLAVGGGIRQWRDGRDRFTTVLLASWAIAGLALAYLPLNFNRRLLEGTFLPLVLLSLPALEESWKRLKIRFGASAFAVAVFASLLLLFPTSLFNWISATGLYAAKAGPTPVLDDGELTGLLEWCRTEAPVGAAFFASPDLSMRLAGWCGVRVYVGHGVATPDVPEKLARLNRFLSQDDDEARLDFLTRQGISFLVAEGRFDPWAGGTRPIWLESVHENGKYRVFRVCQLRFPFCPHQQ